MPKKPAEQPEEKVVSLKEYILSKERYIKAVEEIKKARLAQIKEAGKERILEGPPLPEEALSEQARKEIEEVRLALAEAGIEDLEEVKVGTLPGDVLGKHEAGEITVDRVTLRDRKTLAQVLLHEKLHKKGIVSEGLVEAIRLAAHGGEDPLAEQIQIENVRKVTDKIGVEAAKDLYIQGYDTKDFKPLYEKFWVASRNEGLSEDKIEEEFLDAFPELSIQKRRKIEEKEQELAA